MAANGKGPLRIAIEDFIKTFTLGDVIFGGLKKRIESWESQGVDYINAMYSKWGVTDVIPAILDPSGSGGFVQHAGYDIIGIILIICGSILGSVLSFVSVVSRLYTYAAETKLNTARIGIQDAIRIEFRDSSLTSMVQSDLADQGWTPDRGQALIEINRPRLGIGELDDLVLRNIVDMSYLQNEMEAQDTQRTISKRTSKCLSICRPSAI